MKNHHDRLRGCGRKEKALLLLFEQESLLFHFVPALANYVAVPSSRIRYRASQSPNLWLFWETLLCPQEASLVLRRSSFPCGDQRASSPGSSAQPFPRVR